LINRAAIAAGLPHIHLANTGKLGRSAGFEAPSDWVEIRPTGRHCRANLEVDVIILGLVLLVIGFVLGVPVLWTIGLILLVIGAILFLLGAIGREVGGRRYWY
jgi:hypothetical protein